jgi:NAD(P)-dependent dehydrogenase (short-subunit alcohol dehydrogenase family)
MFTINVNSAFLCAREAVRRMSTAHGGHGGAIVNVSSAAALVPVTQMSVYGASKIALEHVTLDAARELSVDNITVNCFRIDVAVATEGFMANVPHGDHDRWERPEIAAEGLLWMLQQPLPYTGWRESMFELAQRDGVMPSRSTTGTELSFRVTEMFNGLYTASSLEGVVDA